MLELFLSLNWLGVSIGVVICFALGALWFHPKVLGTAWMTGLGKTAKDFENCSSFTPMLVHLLGLITTAILIAYLVAQPGYALGVLLFVLSTIFGIASAMMFQSQGKLQTWAVVAGHEVVCVVILTLCTTLFSLG